ncbi:MAG: hypothetical protein E6343_15445 [Clostridium perfringens]|nr:hypothetical protein [Clostridium perfringens]
MKSSKKKNLIRKLYIEGYNANEIAKKITEENKKDGINKVTTKEAIQKVIQRNFKEFKRQHKENQIKRRETERAIKHESNKWISNRAFIKNNKNIYETKKNGDIVVKSENELGFSITDDTPKKLINSNRKEKNKKSYIDENILRAVIRRNGLKDIFI